MRRLVVTLGLVAGLVVFQSVSTHAADTDGDLVDDAVDVCPAIADPFQGDFDNNGVGDLCEPGITGVNTFEGTPANDLVLGTEEPDTLAGANGNDALYGLGGDDTLDGGDGLDLLIGGPGTDTLTGGASCDVFGFDPVSDGDIITDFDDEVDRLMFPRSAPESDVPPPQPVFGGDDNLVVTFIVDNEEAGTLELEGYQPGVEIQLIVGACEPPPLPSEPPPEPPELDEETPFPCSPIFPDQPDVQYVGITFPLDGLVVNGTPENETLNGTRCSDLIAGDGGLDAESEEEALAPCIDEICSDDVINAGEGNDLIVGDKPYLFGNETGGDDIVYGGNGDDGLSGDGAEIQGCLCEGEGTARGGDDYLFGGNGDDVLFGDAFEIIEGNALGGNDSLYGGAGDDFVFGDTDLLLDGASGGNDLLDGGDGDDFLVGDGFEIDDFSSAGDDILIGGAGDDLLVGDGLLGNAEGNDTFVYDTNSGFGNDLIWDLGNGIESPDTVQFSGPGLTDITDLDNRSTVVDDGLDVVATVFTDAGKTVVVGTIVMLDIGDGTRNSWADIDALSLVDVTVVP